MAQDFLKVRTGVTLKPSGSAPPSPENGDIYYDNGLGQFMFYQNGTWSTLSGSTATPVWLKTTLAYTDFAAAALTNTITLTGISAKTMIHQTVIKHSTAFSGGAIASYTVSIGVAGSNSKYAVPFNVFQAVSNTARSITQADDVESFTGSSTIQATATSTGANLSAATTGSVDVWLLISLLP